MEDSGREEEQFRVLDGSNAQLSLDFFRCIILPIIHVKAYFDQFLKPEESLLLQLLDKVTDLTSLCLHLPLV